MNVLNMEITLSVSDQKTIRTHDFIARAYSWQSATYDRMFQIDVITFFWHFNISKILLRPQKTTKIFLLHLFFKHCLLMRTKRTIFISNLFFFQFTLIENILITVIS